MLLNNLNDLVPELKRDCQKEVSALENLSRYRLNIMPLNVSRIDDFLQFDSVVNLLNSFAKMMSSPLMSP